MISRPQHAVKRVHPIDLNRDSAPTFLDQVGEIFKTQPRQAGQRNWFAALRWQLQATTRVLPEISCRNHIRADIGRWYGTPGSCFCCDLLTGIQVSLRHNDGDHLFRFFLILKAQRFLSVLQVEQRQPGGNKPKDKCNRH